MSGLVGDATQVSVMGTLGGLSRPDVIGFSVGGLILTSTLSSPFGVLFSAGTFAQAHGTNSNADTQVYTTDFSGLVPGSGSVTAYLNASLVTIQQDPVQIIGPPLGHPDYDPSFVPFTAYQNNVASLALTATTTPPDNATSFELCRFTLTAGAVTLPTPDTTNQIRLTSVTAIQLVNATPPYTIPVTSAGRGFRVVGSGTITFPPLNVSNGMIIPLSIQAASVTLQASGADTFIGSGTTPSSAVGSLTPPNGQGMLIVGTPTHWQVLSGAFLPYTPVDPSTLGSAAFENTSFFFQVGNNLSEGNAATIRTNIGVDDTASFGANGSYKFATVSPAFTVQWGTATLATGNGDVVSFPTAFANNVFGVVAIENGTGDSFATWQSNGLSSFKAWLLNRHNSLNPTAGTITFLAWGN